MSVNHEQQKFGFLLLDKPEGPSSHAMVNFLRRITGIKKIGHAGTLDPFASGLMLLAVGRPATRQISRFVKMDKEYIATMKLGEETDSYDRTGEKINTKKTRHKIQRMEVQKTINAFLGKQEQMPPMFSAKKIKGQRLYKLARLGREVARPHQEIIIYDLKIIKYQPPFLKIKVKCSSGTYIRSLAHDIGIKLRCGAYLDELRRTAIGPYQIKSALKTEKINKKNWGKYLFL